MQFDPALVEWFKKNYPDLAPAPYQTTDRFQDSPTPQDNIPAGTMFTPRPVQDPSITSLPKAQFAPAPVRPVQPSSSDWRNDPRVLEAIASASEGVMSGADQIGDASLILAHMDPRRRTPWEATGSRNRLAELRQGSLLGQQRAYQEGQTRQAQGWKSGESALDRASREKIAESHGSLLSGGEEASPEILSLLKGIGIDLPQGTKMGAIKSVLPTVAASQRAKESLPIRKETVEIAGRNATTREEGQKSRQESVGIAQGNLDARLSRMAQVSEATAMKDISPLFISLKRTSKLKAEFEQDPSMVGPINGRVNVIANRWGISAPDTSTFLANLDTLVFDNLYQLSGKQINEAERGDLKQTVFDAYKNGDSFSALLDNYDARLREMISTRLDTLEATNRDVGKLRKLEPGKPGKLIRENINGQDLEGTQEQIDAYKKAIGVK